MPVPPDTRSSLIARLADVGDNDAWREFASLLYEPFIYGQARRYGMQHADARELVQDVLIAVSKALNRFTPDQKRGRFRTWLYAVGRNTSFRYLERIRPADRASGDSRIRAAVLAVTAARHEGLLKANWCPPQSETHHNTHLDVRKSFSACCRCVPLFPRYSSD